MQEFFPVIIVSIFIVIFAFAFMMDAKRSKELKELARRMGFDFHEKNQTVITNFSNFSLFNSGRSRSSTNVFTGQRSDFNIISGDYSYSTGGGKNRRTHSYSYCIIQHEGLDLPSSFLRKENKILDSIGKVFGGQDINFQEDPKFSGTFVLQGKNEEEIREFFNSEVRRGFMEFSNSPIQFESFGNTFVVYLNSKIASKLKEGFMRKTVSLGKVLVEASSKNNNNSINF